MTGQKAYVLVLSFSTKIDGGCPRKDFSCTQMPHFLPKQGHSALSNKNSLKFVSNYIQVIYITLKKFGLIFDSHGY